MVIIITNLIWKIGKKRMIMSFRSNWRLSWTTSNVRILIKLRGYVTIIPANILLSSALKSSVKIASRLMKIAEAILSKSLPNLSKKDLQGLFLSFLIKSWRSKTRWLKPSKSKGKGLLKHLLLMNLHATSIKNTTNSLRISTNTKTAKP